MTYRRLVVGVLAWPHPTTVSQPEYDAVRGEYPKEQPASIPTGTVLRARVGAGDRRVAVVHYLGGLYRVPADFLEPVKET